MAFTEYTLKKDTTAPVVELEGQNILNAFCGDGFVLYQDKNRNDYAVSLPFQFYEGRTLSELGFKVGDKLTVYTKVSTHFVNPGANDKITFELYTSSHGARAYIDTLSGLQKLGNNYEYRFTLVLQEKHLVADSICVRVDNYHKGAGRVKLNNFMLYNGKYNPKSYLIPHGQKPVGRFNYLKKTRSLDLNESNAGTKTVENGVGTVKLAPLTSGYQDIIKFRVRQPITTGWYTFGFMARSNRANDTIIAHLLDPSANFISYFKESLPSNSGDGATKVTLDTQWRYYEVHYGVLTATPVSPIAMFRVRAEDGTHGNIEVKLPYFVDACGSGTWVAHPEDGFQDLYTAGNKLGIHGGNQVDLPSVDTSKFVPKEDYNALKEDFTALKGAFDKVLTNLKESGAWISLGDSLYTGQMKPDNHIAYGTINLFSNKVDGNYYIRTNGSRTENDLAGGIS